MKVPMSCGCKLKVARSATWGYVIELEKAHRLTCGKPKAPLVLNVSGRAIYDGLIEYKRTHHVGEVGDVSFTPLASGHIVQHIWPEDYSI